MEKLRYSVTINAPVQDVWTTMLNDATYREWTSVFNSDSSYEGDWSQGSEIRFLGPDGDGSLAGMIATVEENRPNELISLRYIGQIVNGEDDTTSEAAKAFMGAHEKYAFSDCRRGDDSGRGARQRGRVRRHVRRRLAAGAGEAQGHRGARS